MKKLYTLLILLLVVFGLSAESVELKLTAFVPEKLDLDFQVDSLSARDLEFGLNEELTLVYATNTEVKIVIKGSPLKGDDPSNTHVLPYIVNGVRVSEDNTVIIEKSDLSRGYREITTKISPKLDETAYSKAPSGSYSSNIVAKITII